MPVSTVPTLPTVAAQTTANSSALPASAQPAQTAQQAAVAQAAQFTPSTAASTTKVRPKKSMGARIGLVVVFSLLAGALGVGARFGYDKMQQADTVEEAAVEQVASVLPAIGQPPLIEQFDPLPVRFTDTVVTIENESGVTRVESHLDLATGNFRLTAQLPIGAHETDSYVAYRRGDTFGIQNRGTGPWVAGPEESIESFADNLGFRGVLTMADLLPAGMVPFVTVIAEVDETFVGSPVGTKPPTPAADTDEISMTGRPSDALLGEAINIAGTAPSPTAPAAATEIAVRHYTIAVDTEGFRSADLVTFANRERGIPSVAGVDSFEMWVDADGIIRKLLVTDVGASYLYELRGGSTTSTQLDELIILTLTVPAPEGG